MTSSGLYSAVMAALLCVLVVVGILLSRYRDRLQGAFGSAAKTNRKSVDVAPGVQLTVVEIDGLKVLCGLNKGNLATMAVVGQEDGKQA